MSLLEELERSLENDDTSDDDDSSGGGGGGRRRIKATTYARTVHAQLLALHDRPSSSTASSLDPTVRNRAYLDTGARAESVLERMVRRHRHGLLDVSSGEAVMHAFNYVLLVYLKCEGGHGAAKRSKKLFGRLIGLGEDGGNDGSSGGTVDRTERGVRYAVVGAGRSGRRSSSVGRGGRAVAAGGRT